MEESKRLMLEKLHDSLQDLIGLHRQLLEIVKSEHQALMMADVKKTFELTGEKEVLVHLISQCERNRQSIVQGLCMEMGWSTPITLREIILKTQESRLEISAQYQTDLTALMVLVDRIQKQNDQNGKLVENSLKHVNQMKQNIFGQLPENNTYSAHGTKQSASANAAPRMVSKEV